jgi:hypothetical protein
VDGDETCSELVNQPLADSVPSDSGFRVTLSDGSTHGKATAISGNNDKTYVSLLLTMLGGANDDIDLGGAVCSDFNFSGAWNASDF